MDRGIIFIATGKQFFREAVNAAHSCKAVMPDVPILIFTEAGNHHSVFDEIRVIEAPKFSIQDKVLCMPDSPFEKTLFLDTDTCLEKPVYELFDLLDSYEFMGTHETSRGYYYHHETKEIPICFSEINSGVLAFRMTPNVRQLLADWPKEYLLAKEWLGKHGQTIWALTNDQPSLKIYILPTEYNALRFTGTYLYGDAKIIHGRGNQKKIAKEMNEMSQINRVWIQQIGMMYEFNHMRLGKLLSMYSRVTYLTFKSLLFRLLGR
jgi:hypothetical protein